MRPVLALLLALAVPIAPAQDAYEASVPVMSQSAGDRELALRQALAQVVARVSGDAAGAESLLARAGQLVQRYGYVREAGAGLRLVAAFDPRAVDAALRAEGLPLHGAVSGPAEDVALTVSGLRSAQDYARTLAALRAVGGVSAIRVLAAHGETIELVVRSEGGAARLGGGAALGGALVRDPEAPGLAFVLH